jgi:hypothetical protein
MTGAATSSGWEKYCVAVERMNIETLFLKQLHQNVAVLVDARERWISDNSEFTIPITSTLSPADTISL